MDPPLGGTWGTNIGHAVAFLLGYGLCYWHERRARNKQEKT